MVTILLEQILELLKGWLSSFTTWAEGVAEKLGLIEEQTEYIDDIYDDTEAIKTDTGNIATSNQLIVSNTQGINNRLQSIDPNVTAIKNNVGTISTNTGIAAAFSEDIATNTMNTLDKVTTIASDTTQLRADNAVVKSDLDKIYDAIKWSLLNVEMTETDEGNSPLTFDTDKAANLEGLKFELNFTETGTGVKSPSNPYTITGVSSLSYSVNGTTTNLNLTLLVGDSVYVGIVDVIEGKIILTHKIHTLETRGSYQTASNHNYTLNIISDCKNVAGSRTNDMISEVTTYNSTLGNYFCYYHIFNYCIVGVPDDYNLTDYNNEVAGTKIIYPLASNIEYSLTPAAIAAIKGLNTITSNGNGKITVTYKESVKHYLDKQEG